jgi:hypothetical protein
MIGDAIDDGGEPGFGINIVQACGLNWRLHNGRETPTLVGAGEQITLSFQRQ